MDNYIFTKDQVDETVETIFSNYLQQTNLTPAEQPQGYVTGGLPGAGKSVLLNKISEELSGNIVIINGDTYRQSHPQFEQILKDHGENYPEYTNDFSAQVSEALLRKAAAGKYNLAIEGTFRTSEAPIAILDGLNKAGYETQVLIKAESPDIAWKNTLDRAEKERQLEGIGRVVSREHFDLVNANFLQNTDAVYQSNLAKKTTIYHRDEVIFSSDKQSPDDNLLPSQVIHDTYHFDGFKFEKEATQTARLDLNALANDIRYNFDGQKTNYFFRDVIAFTDFGKSIRMASAEAAQDDVMVLMALQTAIIHHQNGFEIVGSDEFKDKALLLMAEYDLKPVLTDEDQKKDLEQRKQALAAKEKPVPQAENHEKAEQQTETNEKIQTQPEAAESQRNTPAETKAIRGELIESGIAPYRHKEGEKDSPYIVLSVKGESTPKTLWGVDLPRALAESGVQIGDLVTVKHLGNVPVTVKIPLRDQDTDKITGFKDIETIRDTWNIEGAYPKPTQSNPDCISPRDFKGYDVLSIREIHDKISGIVLESEPDAVIHDPKPQGDFLYFYPNGKPVPDNEPKPKTPPDTPEKAKDTGMVAFVGSKDGIFCFAKAGYCQGLLRDPKDNTYHPVIAPICQKDLSGTELKHNYLAFTALSTEKPDFIGNGNMDGTGTIFKYKTKFKNEVCMMKMHPDAPFKPGFTALFDNTYQKEKLATEIAVQKQKEQQNQQQQQRPTNEHKPK